MPVEVPVEVNNSPIELHLPAEAKEKRAIVESKPSPFEVNNSIIELHLPVEAKENRAIIACGASHIIKGNDALKLANQSACYIGYEDKSFNSN